MLATRFLTDTRVSYHPQLHPPFSVSVTQTGAAVCLSYTLTDFKGSFRFSRLISIGQSSGLNYANINLRIFTLHWLLLASPSSIHTARGGLRSRHLLTPQITLTWPQPGSYLYFWWRLLRDTCRSVSVVKARSLSAPATEVMSVRV